MSAKEKKVDGETTDNALKNVKRDGRNVDLVLENIYIPTRKEICWNEKEMKNSDFENSPELGEEYSHEKLKNNYEHRICNLQNQSKNSRVPVFENLRSPRHLSSQNEKLLSESRVSWNSTNRNNANARLPMFNEKNDEVMGQFYNERRFKDIDNPNREIRNTENRRSRIHRGQINWNFPGEYDESYPPEVYYRNHSSQRRKASTDNFSHTSGNRNPRQLSPDAISILSSSKNFGKNAIESINEIYENFRGRPSTPIRKQVHNGALRNSFWEINRENSGTNMYEYKANRGDSQFQFTPNCGIPKLLPKIYSDDTDLMNRKLMTGTENLDKLHDRSYETLPLVAKKSSRPSLQNIENEFLAKQTHSLVDNFVRNDYDIFVNDSPEGHKHIRPLVVEKRKRNSRHERRRQIDENNYDDKSADLTNQAMEERYEGKGGNRRYGRKAQKNNSKLIDEIMYTNWNQARERPNQLTLVANNNQDLAKLSRDKERAVGHKLPNEQNRNKVNPWSSSSSSSSNSTSASYSSIKSPTRRNFSVSPSSISSSPIIWNFSHFYMEKKV